MYEYVEIDGGFEVTDENGRAVATCRVEADAGEIVAALNLVNALAEEFPGLKGDAEDDEGRLIEQEVDGTDLVDFISERIAWDEHGRFHEPDDGTADDGQGNGQRCPGCGRPVPMTDYGEDCYLGNCERCRLTVEAVLTDNQTGAWSVTSYPMEDEDDDSAFYADVPAGACVRVEYDLNFWGGDYDRTGDFSYVPCELIDRLGSVAKAFQAHTGHDPAHIIHYSPDELYTADGEWIDETTG